MSERKEYKDLYKTILEIGKTKINSGISYNELCQTLSEKSFIIDGCSSLAIRKFFCDNFYHIPQENIPEPNPKNLSTHHCTCNFVMIDDACLYLEKLNELEHLKEDGKNTRRLANWAIAIGVISAFIGNWPDWHTYIKEKFYNTTPQAELKGNLIHLKTQEIPIYTTDTIHLDSLH
ncbi:MAG: hypothetical protein IPG12_04830 [Saprospiraceae bacterium]|mgnify:CR=1 FL=1|nr:hypothetical protein [Saprospiraceae bacterium]